MKPIKYEPFALFVLCMILSGLLSIAQAPEKVSYQSVIRVASGELVRSQIVGMQVSILQGSASGTAVYVETHSPTTNINGLASVEVGNGTTGDNFSVIDWGDGSYFLKAETDPSGGTTYTIIGTTEILSVPYALHTKTAETATGTLLDRIETLEALVEANLIANGYTDPRDNNHYNVVKIGEQVWMEENLKYLPSVVGPATSSQTAPYYYVHGYDGTNVSDAKASANYTIYGVLYNWSAAMNEAASSSDNPSGIQGVCPTGWHLPSDAEWTELTDYLGGESVAGGKLKEAGTTHWDSPNTGATNETDFTSLPGGFCNNDEFNGVGGYGYWWSTLEIFGANAWYRYMNYNSSSVYRENFSKAAGFSVRCLRD
ncbi:MAG: fibrobacter succinogenes major paralogous domain-containing protein [Prolixibacteraceae bacterium]|nr:fibrobacter succinogenes major paralogous domain-containing protein [Prolixibacteraceae bacterium]